MVDQGATPQKTHALMAESIKPFDEFPIPRLVEIRQGGVQGDVGETLGHAIQLRVDDLKACRALPYDQYVRQKGGTRQKVIVPKSVLLGAHFQKPSPAVMQKGVIPGGPTIIVAPQGEVQQHILMVAAYREKPGLLQQAQGLKALRTAIHEVAHRKHPIPGGIEAHLPQKRLEGGVMTMQIADHEITPLGIGGQSLDNIALDMGIQRRLARPGYT